SGPAVFRRPVADGAAACRYAQPGAAVRRELPRAHAAGGGGLLRRHGREPRACPGLPARLHRRPPAAGLAPGARAPGGARPRTGGRAAVTITPDWIVYWQAGPFRITATLVFTWLVMALLVLVSWAVTRKLSTGTSVSRGQLLLEILLGGIRGQIREVAGPGSDRYLPFIGTLFLFVATSNVLSVVPGFHPPTGSLSTTSALALCVFVSVPAFGIASRGLRGYLRAYMEPHPLMLPFNLLGEVT